MMKESEYNSITNTIKYYPGLAVNCMKELRSKYPSISSDTLWSILSLEYQRRMKQHYVKSEAMIDKYFRQYEDRLQNGDPPGVIVKLSEKDGFPPCLIAKLILAKYIELTENHEESSSNHANISKYIRDTALIPDARLAYEVFLCTIYDDQYSPIVETMKSSVGQQYEIQLCRQISDLNLAYRDEEYLRKFGYDKTPDVKLDVPIAIDGFIVHWIESKALFGNVEVHRDYTKNQYSSYWNRFGPGLVIYWFGYVETIVSPTEKRFTIRDRLPDAIVTLTK